MSLLGAGHCILPAQTQETLARLSLEMSFYGPQPTAGPEHWPGAPAWERTPQKSSCCAGASVIPVACPHHMRIPGRKKIGFQSNFS